MDSAWIGVIGAVVGAVLSLAGVGLKSWLDRRNALGLKGADLDREAARNVLAEFDTAVAIWGEFRRQRCVERVRSAAGGTAGPTPERLQQREQSPLRIEAVHAAIRAIDRKALELRSEAVRERVSQVTMALWILDDLAQFGRGQWHYDGAVHVMRDEMEQLLGAVIRHHGEPLPDARVPTRRPAATKLVKLAQEIDDYYEAQAKAQEEYEREMAERARKERASEQTARAHVRVQAPDGVDPEADDSDVAIAVAPQAQPARKS